MNQRLWNTLSGYLFLLPYAAVFSLFLLLPLLFGLVLGFLQWDLLSPAPPQWNGLGNYAEAVGDRNFRMAAWATVRFVVMQVPLHVAVALALALAVNGIAPRAQAFFRAAIFFPTLISIAVAGILWRWFYNSEFGFFNALLDPLGLRVPWIVDVGYAMKSLVLMTVWWTLGGSFIILLAGLQQIPGHYYEAASIDGANTPQQFWHITLPLLRPVLLFVVVISIIASFQVFGQALIVTRGGPEYSTRVLVQYIYEVAFTHYRMGYGAAMSWLLFLIIAAISYIQFYLLREK